MKHLASIRTGKGNGTSFIKEKRNTPSIMIWPQIVQHGFGNEFSANLLKVTSESFMPLGNFVHFHAWFQFLEQAEN